MSPLMEYQIADLDNVSIANSRLSSGTHQTKKSPPVLPVDKHVTWSKAHHHFAERIGKLSTVAKKQMQAYAETRHPNIEDEGIEVSLLSDQSPQLVPGIPAKSNNVEAETLMKLWKSLACCDGLLCGHNLGHTVKEGFDCTISWLCCTVVFGPHRRRNGGINNRTMIARSFQRTLTCDHRNINWMKILLRSTHCPFLMYYHH